MLPENLHVCSSERCRNMRFWIWRGIYAYFPVTMGSKHRFGSMGLIYLFVCSSASYQSVSDYICKHSTKYLATTVMQLWLRLRKNRFSFSCHFNIMKYLHLVNTCGFTEEKTWAKWKQRWFLYLIPLWYTQEIIRLAVAMLEGKQKRGFLHGNGTE